MLTGRTEGAGPRSGQVQRPLAGAAVAAQRVGLLGLGVAAVSADAGQLKKWSPAQPPPPDKPTGQRA